MFDEFILSGQYTYTKGKDSKGQQLVRRARHLASLNVSRSFYDGRVSLDLGLVDDGLGLLLLEVVDFVSQLLLALNELEKLVSFLLGAGPYSERARPGSLLIELWCDSKA